MAWSEFALSFVVFFLSHAIPVRPPFRPWLERYLGKRGFTLTYSVLSLGLLAWLISAAGRAPYVELWQYAPWQNHVPLAAMLLACVISALAITRPNPFSFGGANNNRFDPARPGLVRWTRHPLLVAIALWALAHLVANGDLSHVLLFGLFALFALAGGRLVDRRRRREMGSRWQALQHEISAAPRLSFPFWAGEFLWRISAALLLYAGLLLLHPLLFGVSPLS